MQEVDRLPLPNPTFTRPVPPVLPDKLSEAVRVAIKDLTAAENTPGYVVDMSMWFEIRVSGLDENFDTVDTCHVCLAGAVMARVGQGARPVVTPEDFDGATGDMVLANRLRALDSVRSGDLRRALREWHYAKGDEYQPPKLPAVLVTDYAHDSERFKLDVLDCASILEKHGE